MEYGKKKKKPNYDREENKNWNKVVRRSPEGHR